MNKYIVTFETQDKRDLSPKDLAELVQDEFDSLEFDDPNGVKTKVLVVTSVDTGAEYITENFKAQLEKSFKGVS